VTPVKVLVTGGSGFIGSATVETLQQHGYDVVNVDIRPPVCGEKYYPVDITDAAGVLEVFQRERPQCVVHLAAHISVPESVANPQMDMWQNIGGSLSVFEACRKTGVQRVVFASSAAVYGNEAKPPISEADAAAPIAPYGISKWTVETYLQRFYSDWFSSAILRYGNVYGPRQSAEGGAVIANFVRGIVHDGRVIVHGDGSQQRDFVHVRDIARANRMALERSEPLVLNLGSGSPVSVMGLVEIFQSLSERPFEVVHEPPRPGDIHASFFDVTNARIQLGWIPEVPLADGLRQLLEEEIAQSRRV
jgi:UDP-glucose 4-epimerase